VSSTIAQQGRRSRKPVRICVVVPSSRSRQLLRERLTALGYEAHTTESIRDAIVLVKSGIADALVVDVSAFSTAVLWALSRALEDCPPVWLVASVSVVTMRAVASSTWKHSTLWQPFLSPKQFRAELSGPIRN
jgi:hypothetical protein